jgi:hypothetical protein
MAAVALSVVFTLSAVPQVAAQAPQTLPPLPGFVPPYEISRIVRSAGFDPLAPPLREGAAYVVRAVDFRGVNRIVAASEAYGPMEMPPPPYGPPPSYGEPPPEFSPPRMVPFRESAVPALPLSAPSLAPLPAVRPVTQAFPPLPRRRPAEVASRKAADESKPTIGKPDSDVPAPAASIPKKQPSAGPLPD